MGGEAVHRTGDDCVLLYLYLQSQSTGKGCSGSSFCPGSFSNPMWGCEVRLGVKGWADRSVSALSLLALNILAVIMFGRKESVYFHIVHWHKTPSRVGNQLIFSAWSQHSLIYIDKDTEQRILHEEKSGHTACHTKHFHGMCGHAGVCIPLSGPRAVAANLPTCCGEATDGWSFEESSAQGYIRRSVRYWIMYPGSRVSASDTNVTFACIMSFSIFSLRSRRPKISLVFWMTGHLWKEDQLKVKWLRQLHQNILRETDPKYERGPFPNNSYVMCSHEVKHSRK